MTRREYIRKYWFYAVVTSLWNNIFPSVTLAQGILESNNGNSKLTKDYKNHFGIKGSKGVVMKTFEVFNGKTEYIDSSFRVYRNSLGSFIDHKNFLKSNPRYRTNGVFSANTPEEQAKALKRAGYATATNYDNTLINLIYDNNLKKYDMLRLAFEVVIIIGLLSVLIYFASKKGFVSINTSKIWTK